MTEQDPDTATSRPAAPAIPQPAAGECVVLTHGFMANRWMLALLASRLRARGWSTRNWGYPSLRPSVLEHAGRFADLLTELDADPGISRLHLVTHSMGSIIGRAALARVRPRKLGRFVMLAPPNRGSFVATATAGLVGGVLRPVSELSTRADSLVNTLAEPIGIEVGVIAAGWDQLVSLESTRLTMPHGHVTLGCMHSALLFRREAADLTASFLTAGRFPAPTDAALPEAPASRGKSLPWHPARGRGRTKPT